MRLRRFLSAVLAATVLAGLGGAAYLARDTWQPWLDRLRPSPAAPAESDGGHDHHGHGSVERVKLSPQARANLRLEVAPARPESYWKSVYMPGMVVDRPGLSDRGVTAPVAGVVATIAAQPGDTVEPGEALFTLRIVSELVQNSQSELFKATRDLQLNREQIDRLTAGARSGTIPEARLIEFRSQERRLQASVQAYRQELLTRGLTPEQIAAAAEGRFVTEVTVAAPRLPANADRLVSLASASEPPAGADGQPPPAFEVQELKVQLGEQVQAGQVLCLLANHQALLVEGRAFKQEAPLLARVAQHGWPIRAEFAEDVAAAWPPFDNRLPIRHLANTVDPVSRTFAFYLPIDNQSRTYARDGQTFLIWRFRPGQRVRLRVPVEELTGVFVLPPEAVVREGPEAYVFRQNGDFFERRPVHVLYEDRGGVVVANDGSIGAGQFIARNGAAALNRALKALAAGGEGGHDHHGHDH
jgi:biotin carboxyl carrier protein